MDIKNNKNVAVFKTLNYEYPKTKPYHPSNNYPEIKYNIVSVERNNAFEAIRNTLLLLELDKANFGTKDWNPLGSLIKPHDTVLIKPNLVSHFNWGYKTGLISTDSLITHGSVIRAIIDYIIIALEGYGKIIIGDSPVQLSEWGKILEIIGYHEIKSFFETIFPQIFIEQYDFRLEYARRNKAGTIDRFELDTDKGRFFETDLAQFSLHNINNTLKPKYGVVDYSKKKFLETHNNYNHKYLFPKVVFEADVVINLPKLKTHSKAGMTCSLKNLVGIISHKSYLPHFRFGSPQKGGDEYPDKDLMFKFLNDLSHLEWEQDKGFLKNCYNFILKFLKFIYLIKSGGERDIFNVTGGGWYGNDTLWRTILDINMAFFYLNINNVLDENNINRTKYLVLVDGLIGGEKLSPLIPTSINSGLILAGTNPVAIDTVAATLMGFDYRKIKQIHEAFNIKKFPLVNFKPNDIVIKSNLNCKSIDDIRSVPGLNFFDPSLGYKGYIEL